MTDGTSDGTQLVKDIKPGRGSSFSLFPPYLTEFNGKLYFNANDGEIGTELWVTDGTSEGTQLLLEIKPGEDGSYSSDFNEFNNELYFNASNGETGNELFKLTSEKPLN